MCSVPQHHIVMNAEMIRSGIALPCSVNVRDQDGITELKVEWVGSGYCMKTLVIHTN